MNKKAFFLFFFLCGSLFAQGPATLIPPMVSTYQNSNTTRVTGSVTVQATRADDFAQSTGVVTHWQYASYQGTVNGLDVQTVLKAGLVNSGIRHIRDGSASNKYISRELASNKIPTNYVVDSKQNVVPNYNYWGNVGGIGRLFTPGDLVGQNLGPGVIDSFESLNECNLYCSGYYWYATDPANGVPRIMFDSTNTNGLSASHYQDVNPGGVNGWVIFGQTYTTDLANAVHADPRISSIPVIGSSISDGDPTHIYTASTMTNVDYGNMHCYPGGEGDPNLGTYAGTTYYGLGTNEPLGMMYSGYPFTKWGRAFSPDAATATKWFCTESGYYSFKTGMTAPFGIVPEDTEAKYIPRLFAENYRNGVARTFLYELRDEFNSNTDFQGHYGLFRYDDLSPKPAYTAVASLLHLVEEPNQSVFTPGSLTYSMTVAVNGAYTKTNLVHDLLLQKSTGQFYTLVWHEIAAGCYNCDGTGPVNGLETYLPQAPPMTTTFTYTTPITKAILYQYDANWNLQPTQLPITANSVTVNVLDSMSVLMVK